MKRCTEEISQAKKTKIENGSSSGEHLHENGVALKVQVGSRKSQLALFQTNYVVNELRKHSNIEYGIVTMNTIGDNILNVALSKIGEKSLFTKELEVALEKREVHMVVHSLKDLPTSLPSGMVIGAICLRENPYDAVVFRSHAKYKELNELPEGSVIGTSSLRRIAQLKRCYPKLNFQSVRGNLNTRLRKLDEDQTYIALILAAAGLNRLDLSHRIAKILSPKTCMYAVGQGALAIECREDDVATLELLSKISDEETTLCCVAERSFMKVLEGGCSVPVAVHSYIKDNKLTLKGGVFSLDGSKCLIDELSTDLNSVNNGVIERDSKVHVGIVALHMAEHMLSASETLGQDLALMLLQKGASEILKEARMENSIS